MKRFLPTPTQARNVLFAGLALLLVSPIIREEFAPIFQALAGGLILIGLLCNGFAAALATWSGAPAPSDEAPKQ